MVGAGAARRHAALWSGSVRRSRSVPPSRVPARTTESHHAQQVPRHPRRTPRPVRDARRGGPRSRAQGQQDAVHLAQRQHVELPHGHGLPRPAARRRRPRELHAAPRRDAVRAPRSDDARVRRRAGVALEGPHRAAPRLRVERRLCRHAETQGHQEAQARAARAGDGLAHERGQGAGAARGDRPREARRPARQGAPARKSART